MVAAYPLESVGTTLLDEVEGEDDFTAEIVLPELADFEIFQIHTESFGLTKYYFCCLCKELILSLLLEFSATRGRTPSTPRDTVFLKNSVPGSSRNPLRFFRRSPSVRGACPAPFSRILRWLSATWLIIVQI